jgi:hypothetical protein
MRLVSVSWTLCCWATDVSALNMHHDCVQKWAKLPELGSLVLRNQGALVIIPPLRDGDARDHAGRRPWTALVI